MGRSISEIAREISELDKANRAGSLSDIAFEAAKAALVNEMKDASSAAKAERPSESTGETEHAQSADHAPAALSDLLDGGDEVGKKVRVGWWTINLGAEESAAPYYGAVVGFLVLFGLQWVYGRYAAGYTGFLHTTYMVGIFLAIQFASWVIKDAHDVVRPAAPRHFLALIPAWLWGFGVAMMCCAGAPIYLGLRLHVAVAHGGERALQGRVWNSLALGVVLFVFASGVGLLTPVLDELRGKAYIEWQCVQVDVGLQCTFSNTGSGTGSVCLDAVLVCGDGRHVAEACSSVLEAGTYESRVIDNFAPRVRSAYGCAIEYENAAVE